jgi:geranylgeranylglycerol-phosphate geranylgeranyltransferase
MKFGPFFQLIRFHNAAAIGLCVFVGAHLTGQFFLLGPNPKILLAVIIAFLITAGGNALNDYFDLAVDRINRPLRPLPSGKILPPTAIRIGMALPATGVLLSTLLDFPSFLITFIFAGLAYCYSPYVKRTLAANFFISGLTGASIVYGGIISGSPGATLQAGIIATFFMASREILKVIADFEGDALFGIRTIATVFGKTTALYCYYGFSAVTLLVSLLPYLSGRSSLGYLMVTLAGADLVIWLSVMRIARNPSGPTIRSALSWTKFSVFVWLAALLI